MPVLSLLRHDFQLVRAMYNRYKAEIRKDDKAGLRQLIKVQYHYQVTPEIHHELDASRYEQTQDLTLSVSTDSLALTWLKIAWWGWLNETLHASGAYMLLLH